MRNHHVLAAVLVAILAACGAEPTDPAAFHREWDRVTEQLPPLDALTAQEPDELCADVLTGLREARADLVAAPTASLATASQRWLDVAENTFFECPPDGGDISSFDEAYETLTAIDAEIDSLRPAP